MVTELERVQFVQNLFNELKHDGFIEQERELVIVDKGPIIRTENSNESKIFFNKKYEIPNDERILTLFITHEEAHKRFPQFRRVYSHWILSLSGLVFLFVFFELSLFIPFNIALVGTFTGFFTFSGILLHLFSKSYFKSDEINADIYAASCVMKKYNENNPSLLIKNSFGIFNSLRPTYPKKPTYFRLIFSNLIRGFNKIWYLFYDTHPSHEERVKLIKTLFDRET